MPLAVSTAEAVDHKESTFISVKKQMYVSSLNLIFFLIGQDDVKKK